MAKYFDKFPLVRYDIDRNQLTKEQLITNILFRIDFIKEILDNMSSYSLYAIREGDTPEVLAEKIYGNSEAHWLILYANNIVDPHYDWPMDSRTFNRYIVKKYTAAFAAANPTAKVSTKTVSAWIQTQPYAYYKVVKTVNTYTETETIRKFEIDKQPLSGADINAQGYKYDTYQNNGTYPGIDTSLPTTIEYTDYYIGEKLIKESTYSEMVSIFDYELEINENKRLIKLIKPNYYSQIYAEFLKLTGNDTDSSTVRSLS